MNNITERDIEEFISRGKRVVDENLTRCSSGNLSWRIGDKVLLSATGSWIGELTKGDIAICDLKTGESLNGVKPTMEKIFHLDILRKRPEMDTVLHFQSPYATTIACMKNRPTNFNVTLEIPIYIGENIPVIPFLKPGSAELAEAVTEAMLQHDCIILENHGLVVCGKNFKEALQKALFFEMACEIILKSKGDYKTLIPSDYSDFLNK